MKCLSSCKALLIQELKKVQLFSAETKIFCLASHVPRPMNIKKLSYMQIFKQETDGLIPDFHEVNTVSIQYLVSVIFSLTHEVMRARYIHLLISKAQKTVPSCPGLQAGWEYFTGVHHKTCIDRCCSQWGYITFGGCMHVCN
jgi:hypothetical protein